MNDAKLQELKTSLIYLQGQLKFDMADVKAANTKVKNRKKEIADIRKQIKSIIFTDPTDTSIRWSKIGFQQNIYFAIEKWHSGKINWSSVVNLVNSKKKLYKKKAMAALVEIDKVEKLGYEESKKLAYTYLSYVRRYKKRW